MAYALIKGTTTSGLTAIKVLEVKDVKKAPKSWTPGFKLFTIVKPLFGSYFSLRKGGNAHSKFTTETLEEIKDIVKELIIKNAFSSTPFHNLEQTIKGMNGVK